MVSTIPNHPIFRRIVEGPHAKRAAKTRPSIEHLHHALQSDFDVGWLPIAMHNAALVRRFQRLGDLGGVVERRP
jgi:hypothetical protein